VHNSANVNPVSVQIWHPHNFQNLLRDGYFLVQTHLL